MASGIQLVSSLHIPISKFRKSEIEYLRALNHEGSPKFDEVVYISRKNVLVIILNVTLWEGLGWGR